MNVDTNTTRIVCNPYNTLNQYRTNATDPDFQCNCHRGYYGETCVQQYTWYAPIVLTVYIIEAFVMFMCAVWTFCRILYMVKQDKFKINLAMFSIILSTSACVLRFIYLVLPSRSIHQAIEDPNITYTKIILEYLSILLWVSTTLLVKGFWYDLIQKMSNHNISVITTIIVCLTSGVVLVGTIAGVMLLITVQGARTIGLFIIILVLLAAVIIMTIYTHKVRKLGKAFTETNMDKVKWTTNTFISLDVLWSMYVFANILTAILSMTNNDMLNIIPDILFRLSECGIAICILLLLDYNLNSIRFIMNGCKGGRTIISTDNGSVTKKSKDPIPTSQKSTNNMVETVKESTPDGERITKENASPYLTISIKSKDPNDAPISSRSNETTSNGGSSSTDIFESDSTYIYITDSTEDMDSSSLETMMG